MNISPSVSLCVCLSPANAAPFLPSFPPFPAASSHLDSRSVQSPHSLSLSLSLSLIERFSRCCVRLHRLLELSHCSRLLLSSRIPCCRQTLTQRRLHRQALDAGSSCEGRRHESRRRWRCSGARHDYRLPRRPFTQPCTTPASAATLRIRSTLLSPSSSSSFTSFPVSQADSAPAASVLLQQGSERCNPRSRMLYQLQPELGLR